MSDRSLFNKLMDHLLSELSYESLLFLIETAQFKRACLRESVEFVSLR